MGIRSFALLVGLASTFVSAGGVDAQSILGTVSNEGKPVAGALVEVRDSTAQRPRQRLTDVSGGFSFDLPRSGTWSLSVASLGMSRVDTAVVVQREFRRVDVVLETRPLDVEGVLAEVDDRCGARDRQELVPGLWAFARRLFLPRDSSLMRFEVERRNARYGHWEQIWSIDEYARRLNPGDRHITTDTSVVVALQPITTPGPRGSSEEGFITTLSPNPDVRYLYDYDALVPEVVLSETFLEDHCFSYESAEGWVGLGFRPRRGSGIRYDVEGTLWIPQTADSLPHLEYRFRPMPRESELFESTRGAGPTASVLVETSLTNRVGARVQLAPVEGVGWVISQFDLYWPDVGNGRPIRFVYPPEVRQRVRNGTRLEDIEGPLPRARRRAVWQLVSIYWTRFRVLSVGVQSEG